MGHDGHGVGHERYGRAAIRWTDWTMGPAKPQLNASRRTQRNQLNDRIELEGSPRCRVCASRSPALRSPAGANWPFLLSALGSRLSALRARLGRRRRTAPRPRARTGTYGRPFVPCAPGAQGARLQVANATTVVVEYCHASRPTITQAGDHRRCRGARSGSRRGGGGRRQRLGVDDRCSSACAARPRWIACRCGVGARARRVQRH